MLRFCFSNYIINLPAFSLPFSSPSLPPPSLPLPSLLLSSSLSPLSSSEHSYHSLEQTPSRGQSLGTEHAALTPGNTGQNMHSCSHAEHVITCFLGTYISLSYKHVLFIRDYFLTLFEMETSIFTLLYVSGVHYKVQTCREDSCGPMRYELSLGNTIHLPLSKAP